MAEESKGRCPAIHRVYKLQCRFDANHVGPHSIIIDVPTEYQWYAKPANQLGEASQDKENKEHAVDSKYWEERPKRTKAKKRHNDD